MRIKDLPLPVTDLCGFLTMWGMPAPSKRREYHLRRAEWRCQDCASRGLTLRGYVLHKNAHPLHGLVLDDAVPSLR